jgi:hypothetical protein
LGVDGNEGSPAWTKAPEHPISGYRIDPINMRKCVAWCARHGAKEISKELGDEIHLSVRMSAN